MAGLRRRILFGCVGLAVALPVRAASVRELTAETSNASNGMHAVGAPVDVGFSLRGFGPGERHELLVTVEDAWGRTVASNALSLTTDAAGNWRGAYRAPGDRRGFFRLRARTEDGVTLPKRGSRPAGCLTYAVVVSPADRPVLGEDEAFAGVHGEVYEGTHVAPWLGARQLMDNQRFFPDGAAYGKELARRTATGWTAYGYCALALINRAGSHPWTFLSPEGREWYRNCGTYWKAYSDPEGRRHYAEAVGRIAAAGRTQTYFQKRRIYEPLWEPDISAPSPEAIVEGCRLAREAVKKADPDALIMGPTLCNVFQRNALFRQCCAAGLLEHIDIFSVHAYNPYPPEPNDFVANVREIKDILRAFGRADMPMVSTEHGFSAPAGVDSELRQMNGMVRQQLILLGEGFKFALPFVVKDYGGDFADCPEGDYGIFYNLTLELPNRRWSSKCVSPRPVAAALAAFSEVLDGFRPTAVIDTLGDTVLGYAYQNAQGATTIALWDWGEGPSSVDLPVGVENAEIVDVMGNARPVAAPGGVLRLDLGPSPVYVRGLSAGDWGRDGRLAARMKAESERRRLERERARTVDLRSLKPAFDGSRPAVACVLENRTDEDLGLELSATLRKSPAGAMRATLRPKESRRLLLPLTGVRTDPFLIDPVRVSVRPSRGSEETRVGKMNFLRVRELPGVGVKGDFSAWRNPAYRDLPAGAVRNAAAYRGVSDVRAKAAFGWNADYLLVDILVEDDEFRQEKTGWWTWDGDSVQLGFAKAKLERRTSNALADAFEQAASEVTFALTKNGPEGCRTQSFDPVRYPRDVNGNGRIDAAECPFSVTRESLDGGRVRLRYRVAYPWAYMNRTSPRPGDHCLFAAYVVDRDSDAARPACLGLFALQPLAPDGFGYLCLEK